MERLFSFLPCCWEPGAGGCWENIIHLLGLATLIAITIFRREISCNHVYAAEQQQQQRSAPGSESSIGETTTSESESEQNNSNNHNTTRRSSIEHYIRSSQAFLAVATTLLIHISLLWVVLLPNKQFVRKLWESLLSWWDAASEYQRLDELLEGVGGTEISGWWWPHTVLLRPLPPPSDISILVVPSNHHQPLSSSSTASSIFPAAAETLLPVDALVHMASFLHPKDVLSFGCVNRQASEFIGTHHNETDVSRTLWKVMWYRDYAWILQQWHVGHEAVLRSLRSLRRKDPFLLMNDDDDDDDASITEFEFHRDFYFRFGFCCIDYILAGQYSADRCLVGLGGHIYDLTDFLPLHPGSPETVIIHAGCDASDTFTKIRHTVQARAMAKRQCIIVDMARCQQGGCGLRPTQYFDDDDDRTTASGSTTTSSPQHRLLPPIQEAIVPDARPVRRPMSGAQAALERFLAEEQKHTTRRLGAMKSKYPNALDQSIHGYFDPFCGEWKSWFVNTTDFGVVFLDE